MCRRMVALPWPCTAPVSYTHLQAAARAAEEARKAREAEAARAAAEQEAARKAAEKQEVKKMCIRDRSRCWDTTLAVLDF